MQNFQLNDLQQILVFAGEGKSWVPVFEQISELNLPEKVESSTQFKWISLNLAFEKFDLQNQQLLKEYLKNYYPVFSAKNIEPDWQIPFWERGVAVIKVVNFKSSENFNLSDTTKFAVYRRFDNLLRFPGGHIDGDENYIQAAARETEEETGLTGLYFKKYLGSCHNFVPYKNAVNHVPEHYGLFEVYYQNWLEKKEDEQGMQSLLAAASEIKQNDWKQIDWIFGKVESLIN